MVLLKQAVATGAVLAFAFVVVIKRRMGIRISTRSWASTPRLHRDPAYELS